MTLGRTMPYGIYLPPGYDSSARRYPVLYMLHGLGGHYSEWVAYGLADAAEQLLAAGRIEPLIIVFPQGDQNYWANHAGSRGERWGDYLANDVVGHIDATYRTLPGAGTRAIGGLSMGGFGALHLALTCPDVFGVVGAHSPSLRTAEELSDLFVGAGPAAPVDPLVLATILDPARAPRIRLDLGDEDQWAERAIALHDVFRLRGIRHEYHATPGGHDADYWRNHVAAYLRFYAAALHAR